MSLESKMTHDHSAGTLAGEDPQQTSQRTVYEQRKALALIDLESLIQGGDRKDAISVLAEVADIVQQSEHQAPYQEAVSQVRRASLTGTVTATRTVEPASNTHAQRLRLTSRELDVLELLAQGDSNAAIANKLFISPKTATVHVTHILAKLGAANRTQAAATAFRLGLDHAQT
jgi:DNA-binding NarL/FixJ family response regulator